MKNRHRLAVLGMILLLTASAAACDTNNGGTSAGTDVTASQEAGTDNASAGTESSSGTWEGQRPERPDGTFGEGEMPSFPEGSFPEGEMPSGEFGGRGGHGGRGENGGMPGGQMPGGQGQMPGGPGGMMNSQTVTSAENPTEIVKSTLVSTASQLEADEASAETIVMSEGNAEVKIESAGTYVVTGTCSDGSITVKKGTEGVVLILKDLDLTSTTGAPVSCNKDTQVKIVIEGNVKLTDAEDPADEDSSDPEIADAFDGAALKIKDGADVVLTGTGTLTIDASACKNGIKSGNENEPVFVIDGSLTIDITAANDGINAGYDLTILSGTVTVSAGDDAIHADRILTIGSEDGSGPEISVTDSSEGLEGTVVNLFGGSGTVKTSDDGINAANKDKTYAAELAYSINITGGEWTVNAGGDGLDSNGDINITGGHTTVSGGSAGGEGGVDWVGSLYYEDGALTNNSGFAFDGMQH